jgi:hypothetical protein
MSHNAESIPAIALNAMPPVCRTDRACRSHQMRSACIGSCPTIISARRSTIAAIGPGEPQSVQSPHPTRPSSLVSILTNVQGRKPPSTMKVLTPVMRRATVRSQESGCRDDSKRPLPSPSPLRGRGETKAGATGVNRCATVCFRGAGVVQTGAGPRPDSEWIGFERSKCACWVMRAGHGSSRPIVRDDGWRGVPVWRASSLATG